MSRRPAPPVIVTSSLCVVASLVWAALIRLAVACIGSELQWRYVAEHTRRDATWYYRLAGVWGGSEGSLLLFAAIAAAVAVAAVRRSRRSVTAMFALVQVGALALIVVAVAWPFDRLDAPAVRGFGLTPILEHPAMAVHPPLLYLGLCCSLGAMIRSIDGAPARLWWRWSAALIVAAMALGAIWSYVEQGWGGYWAWDPVENSSLVVWLLVLLVVHGGDACGGAQRMLHSAPWVAALLGAALTRSGSAPSVHSFAGQRAVGWSLLVLAVVTAVIGMLLSAATVPDDAAGAGTDDGVVGGERGSRRAHTVINLTVVGLVVLGTAVPVIRSFGNGDVAVRGVFFSRTVAPLALMAALFIVPRLRWRRGRLAHLGVLVLLIGIGASTFDRAVAVGLSSGQRATIAGLDVVAGPVEVVDGPRRDVQAVRAQLTVEGVTMLPSLVAYPERGGVLAETAVHSTPWRDIQVTLNNATDDQRMLVVIRQRPLMWLVWIGAASMSLGSLPGLKSLGRRRRSVVSQSSS